MKNWLLAAGVGAGILYWMYREATTCSRCQQLSREGDFEGVLDGFERPCRQCVQIGIDSSIPALEALMDRADSGEREELQETLRLYWHNLFKVGKRAGMSKQVGQNLINLQAAEHPVLVRYHNSGYSS